MIWQSVIKFINDWFCPVFGFITLAGLLLYSFFRKKFPSPTLLKKIIILIITIIIAKAILFSVINIISWRNDPVSQYLLPPSTPVLYTIRYLFTHYWFSILWNFIFAFIVFEGMKILNNQFAQVFFYDEEKYLASIGILLTGWPNCLVYLILVLLSGVLSHFFVMIFKKTETRLSLLYWWLPMALIVFCLNAIITKNIFISQFAI
ncbi:MAG: hypothetical protein KBI15_02400 [Candidatus Pacebacteria bacterium]|nr:hypothetical protein [Candidatus Paceibacterota bacterium]